MVAIEDHNVQVTPFSFLHILPFIFLSLSLFHRADNIRSTAKTKLSIIQLVDPGE